MQKREQPQTQIDLKKRVLISSTVYSKWGRTVRTYGRGTSCSSTKKIKTETQRRLLFSTVYVYTELCLRSLNQQQLKKCLIFFLIKFLGYKTSSTFGNSRCDPGQISEKKKKEQLVSRKRRRNLDFAKRSFGRQYLPTEQYFLTRPIPAVSNG